MLKKIIYLIVSGGLLLSGCSLDYEPLNGPSSGSFPASEEEAMAGLYAAYKGLANMTVKETPFPMRINDCISDIGTYRTGAGNQIKAMSSTLTADNTMCEKVYKTVYKIAGRVHLVLDNLDRLRGVIPEDRFNQIKAELLCIRAYYYDLGCQFYGDIPFIDHQLDLDDYSDYPRIPREQVTARLLQDLDDDLLDYLPVQWNPGTYGTTRIGRVAAYALKARIALNCCGRRPHAVRRSPRRSPRASTISNRSTAPTTLPTPTANLRRRTYSDSPARPAANGCGRFSITV